MEQKYYWIYFKEKVWFRWVDRSFKSSNHPSWIFTEKSKSYKLIMWREITKEEYDLFN